MKFLRLNRLNSLSDKSWYGFVLPAAFKCEKGKCASIYCFRLIFIYRTERNGTKRNGIQQCVAWDKIWNLGFALITNAFQVFQCIDHFVGHLCHSFSFFVSFLVYYSVLCVFVFTNKIQNIHIRTNMIIASTFYSIVTHWSCAFVLCCSTFTINCSILKFKLMLWLWFFK